MSECIGSITLGLKEKVADLGSEKKPENLTVTSAWTERDADGLWACCCIERAGALVEARREVYQAQKDGSSVRVK
jgi:hypothetical protein